MAGVRNFRNERAGACLQLRAGASPDLARAAIYHRGMSDDFPAFALSEEHDALREAVRALDRKSVV